MLDRDDDTTVWTVHAISESAGNYGDGFISSGDIMS